MGKGGALIHVFFFSLGSPVHLFPILLYNDLQYADRGQLKSWRDTTDNMRCVKSGGKLKVKERNEKGTTETISPKKKVL